MKNILFKSGAFFLAAVLSASVWAAESPIGALTIKGKTTITAGDSTFTLQDQEYAYFSNDKITVGSDSQAMVVTTDGLKVTFLPMAEARITKDEGIYNIDLQEGAMVLDVRQDVAYQMTHQGEVVSVDQKYLASDKPYVAGVAPGGEEVQFYMPAQLAAGAGSLAALSTAQIAALVAAGIITTGVVVNEVTDEGPSS